MNWIRLGTLIVSALPRIITIVERLRGSQPGQGTQKRQDVKDLILTLVETTESAAGRDLLNDAEIGEAYDAMNDAIVKFQNVVARKAATPVP